ncbi:MAG: leucine-rich repeat protein [Clostridia bacterium]|nr:leucine-rich repeat protein [Clostridia bacterium]
MSQMKKVFSVVLCALLLVSATPTGIFAGIDRSAFKASASVEPDIFDLLEDGEQASAEALLAWFNDNVNRLKDDDYSQSVTAISGVLEDIRYTNINAGAYTETIADEFLDTIEYNYDSLHKNVNISQENFPVFDEDFVSALTAEDLQSIRVTEASGVDFLQDLPDAIRHRTSFYNTYVYKNMPVPEDMIRIEITLQTEVAEDGVYTVGGKEVQADTVMPSERFVGTTPLHEDYEQYPVEDTSSDGDFSLYTRLDCNKIERNSCAVWYFDRTTLEPVACKYTYSQKYDQHFYILNEMDSQNIRISVNADVQSELRNDDIYLFSDYYQYSVNSTADGIQYTVNDDKAIIIGYTGSATELAVPSVIDTYPVTMICDAAFSNCTKLQSVTIPQGVTSIGDSAFYKCTSLALIEIPQGATSIGDSAFYNCTSLASIKIPQGVTSIGDSAFYKCTSLASITIPQGATSIGDSAFYNCTSLTSIKIPQGVTSIGDSAFYDCTALESVEIPQSVTNIGRNAFICCSNLTSVHISDIAAWCGIDFADNYSNPLYYANDLYLNEELVTDLVIPDGVTSINARAFYGCTALESVELPQSVASIGDNAFFGCTALTDITIPNRDCSFGDSVFPYLNIHGYKDSTAQAYAKRYGHSFVALDASPEDDIFYGDVDDNGSIEASDARLILRMTVGLEEVTNIADIDGDGAVTPEDARLILRVAVGSETHPGSGHWLTAFGGTVKADHDPSVSLEADWEVEDGYVYVDVYLDNAIGATSWLFDLTFDSDILAFEYWDDGVAVWECGETKNNRMTIECGDSNVTERSLKIGGYMTQALWTQEDFTADARSSKDAQVNPDHAHLLSLYFTVENAEAFNAGDVSIAIEGTVTYSGLVYNSWNYAKGDPEQVSDSVTKVHTEHPWNAGEVTKEPTCTEKGVKTYTCTLDESHTYTEEIPTIEHDYKATVTAPTCAEKGFTTYACSRCDESYTADETEALGHDYKSEVTREPALHVCGEITYTCSVCDDVYTEETRMLHNFVLIENKATCTTFGTFCYMCECGYGECGDTGELPLGHDYKATVIAPTCTKGGYTTYACSRCDETYTADATEALGHDYKATVTAPTCTKDGFTAYTCSHCSDSYTADTIPAAGHKHKTIVVPPTVTSQGYTAHICPCGDTYADNYVDPVVGENAFVKDDALVGLSDTTAATLLAQISEGATLKKADGTAKKADEKVGTGDKLVLSDGTEIIISVLGDINGDGEVATSDARLVLRKAVNLETFNGAQDTAARVDGGEKVDVAHARKILRASVNLEKAEDWFKALAK